MYENARGNRTKAAHNVCQYNYVVQQRVQQDNVRKNI